jgi:hypothetical protein
MSKKRNNLCILLFFICRDEAWQLFSQCQHLTENFLKKSEALFWRPYSNNAESQQSSGADKIGMRLRASGVKGVFFFLCNFFWRSAARKKAIKSVYRPRSHSQRAESRERETFSGGRPTNQKENIVVRWLLERNSSRAEQTGRRGAARRPMPKAKHLSLAPYSLRQRQQTTNNKKTCSLCASIDTFKNLVYRGVQGWKKMPLFCLITTKSQLFEITFSSLKLKTNYKIPALASNQWVIALRAYECFEKTSILGISEILPTSFQSKHYFSFFLLMISNVIFSCGVGIPCRYLWPISHLNAFVWRINHCSFDWHVGERVVFVRAALIN